MSTFAGADPPDGATRIDEDEAADLLPPNISTQAQLNEWEQLNIAIAVEWLLGQKLTVAHVLSTDFACRLHQRMFDRTWRWAGTFRRSDKSIGLPWFDIQPLLKDLFDHTRAQLHTEAESTDEVAARLHHGLVFIHPFPNGNGRHARLLTDALLTAIGQAPFSWGRKPLTAAGAPREEYIRALKRADRGDFRELIEFVRS